jgi:hypothetical protein
MPAERCGKGGKAAVFICPSGAKVSLEITAQLSHRFFVRFARRRGYIGRDEQQR